MTGAALFRLALPVVAGVAGALYSSVVRGHPWEAALAVGLAIGTLSFAALRARERIGRIHRQARSPWERDD